MKKSEKIVLGAVAGIAAGAALGMLIYWLQKGSLSCECKWSQKKDDTRNDKKEKQESA